MDFSPIPISDQKYLNYIFIGILVGNKPVTAMFDTRGNTLIPQSLADELDLTYIDQEPIDSEKGFRRAKLSSMALGDLKLEGVPVVVCKDQVVKLANDTFGNPFPAQVILGWNIISQFVFRGDLRKNQFEVQISDFKENKRKGKENTPVFKLIFNKKTYKAAIDTSRPLTIISENLAKDLKPADDEVDKTISMLGIDHDEVIYESKFAFTIDDNIVNIPTTQVEKDLNDKEIQIVFGADLLRNTTWAMYNPLGYFRARN
ncbi:retropepsin-like aspartic protease [uncultured Anaerococcus sp.]|uniref:retropepsin-like aspartic protease n=1 Tax=uncultured Anaerococcus sp. TaxID=293428 RepID=UPI0026040154|nr:retropepsin-like aspartic protease [uncultured Anaerococcus sp.]